MTALSTARQRRTWLTRKLSLTDAGTAYVAASRRILLQAGLAAPVLVSAASRRAMAQDPRRVIRAVPIGDLRVLDPIWTTAYITRNHGYLVYDTLFALAEGQVEFGTKRGRRVVNVTTAAAE